MNSRKELYAKCYSLSIRIKDKKKLKSHSNDHTNPHSLL